MKIVFASATRQPSKEAFFEKTWLGRSLSKLGAISPHPFAVELALESSEGLPLFYNSVLEKNPDADAIVFAHDDLAIVDLFFFEKLGLAIDEFPVLGLCGCQTPKDEAHTAWMSPKHTPSGQIGTSIRSSTEAVLSTNISTFGQTPARAAECDGVFIAVDPKRIEDLRFDERFAYHHYDVDFTLTADKRGINVGTWPIFTIYASNSGDGYLSRSWRKSSEVFCDKWEAKKEAA